MGQVSASPVRVVLQLLLFMAVLCEVRGINAAASYLISSELHWTGFLDGHQREAVDDIRPAPSAGISFLQTGMRRAKTHRHAGAALRRLTRRAKTSPRGQRPPRRHVAPHAISKPSSMMEQADRAAQAARSKREQVQHLFEWMVQRYCNRICQSLDEADACHANCKGSLTRLREASDQIRPARMEEFIEFPNVPDSKLRSANDKTQYTGMMFAGSAKFGSNTTFVARLCTHGCSTSASQYDSTLVLGELQSRGQLHTKSTLQWQHLSEYWVPHHDGDMANRSYVGPEDPRMDIVQNRRFLTLTMNVDASKFGCRGGKKNRDVRHMYFVPIDSAPNFNMCDIRVDGVDKCHVQKNWASLVPPGSSDVFYVYSIQPLQIFRFAIGTCQTAWVNLPNDRNPSRNSSRPFHFDEHYSVHGGTRYVFGGKVVDGDLFWSVGHTARPEYRPVVVGVLHRTQMLSQSRPEFQVVGVSCPINVSTTFGEKLKPSDEDWDEHMMIATSIVDFDLENDISTITFQVHDNENYQTQLLGVGRWLQTVYKEYSAGVRFSCHDLH